jgi:hypothetical protein
MPNRSQQEHLERDAASRLAVATGILVHVTRTVLARSLRRSPNPGGSEERAPRRLPGADSAWWIGLAAAAFTASQLAFVSPRLGLSWDEAVYVSQVSGHAPAAYFDPARARGIPLLVAPVTLLTSSVIALRAYLSVASGLGLFGALLAWRGLRPAWLLALAGLAFGSLWVAQYYGPQAMPDLWVALSALAAVGLFLQAANRLGRVPATEPGAVAAREAGAVAAREAGAVAAREAGAVAAGEAGAVPAGEPAAASAGPAWPWLAGLAACVAAAALVRPGDAVFLAVPLLAATAVVAGWRRWQLAAAAVAGLAAGCAEWVAEAYLRFGGPLARLHAAGAEQGGFALHFAVWAELRAVNGPTLCRPCTVGWRRPELSLWWLALPVLVALGLLAARRAGRLGSALLPAVCGFCVAVQYLFLIDYAAPRFLLPAYALLALPVADGIGWLLTGVRPDLQPLTRFAVVFCLAAQVLAQHLVLDHEVGGTITFHNDYTRIVADLRSLGVRPPCLIKGQQYIPIAFYAGCASAPGLAGAARSERVALLEYQGTGRPRYVRGWRRHLLPGTRVLRLVAYLPPRQPR